MFCIWSLSFHVHLIFFSFSCFALQPKRANAQRAIITIKTARMQLYYTRLIVALLLVCGSHVVYLLTLSVQAVRNPLAHNTHLLCVVCSLFMWRLRALLLSKYFWNQFNWSVAGHFPMFLHVDLGEKSKRTHTIERRENNSGHFGWMQAKKSGGFSYFSEMVHIMLFNGHMNDEQWARNGKTKRETKSISFSCYRTDPTHEKRMPIPIFSRSNKWLLICA